MSKRIAAVAGVAMFWGAGPAVADVTALQVWEEWQQIQEALGYESFAAQSQTLAAGILTLEGVDTVTTQDGVVWRGTLDRVVMEELGDGTVRITASPAYRVTITDEAEDFAMEYDIALNGLEIIASGDDVRVLDIVATGLSFNTPTTLLDGEPVPAEIGASVMGLTAQYEVDMAQETLPYEVDAQVAIVELSVEFDSPSTDGGLEGTYQYNDVTSTVRGELGAGGDQFPSFGASAIGTFDFANSTASAVFNFDGTAGQVEGITGAGTSSFTTTVEQFAFDTSVDDTGVRVQLESFPFPLEVSLGTASSSITAPVAQSETPQDFDISVALRDVVLSDFIWGLFDGAGQIPRDPATIAVDLEGSALLFVDLFSETETLETLEGPIGALLTTSIRELLVEFGGASLTGNGAVTFETVDGVPDPIGTVDMLLEGGFALLDALSAAGIIPQGQAAGLRAMSGVFATPVGEDTLSSTIQFVPDGGIVLNGFPVQ